MPNSTVELTNPARYTVNRLHNTDYFLDDIMESLHGMSFYCADCRYENNSLMTTLLGNHGINEVPQRREGSLREDGR